MIHPRFLLASLIALYFLPVSAISAEPKPNIVFFLVDDMGWMDSSVYGSEYYETPNMERLAKQSMRFTNAYAQPLCSPCRASILSGQHPSRHGVTTASGHRPPLAEGESPYKEKAAPNVEWLFPASKNYLEPDIVTVGEALKEAGYRTGHFGKWHLGLMPQHWPEEQGFETTWHCAPDPGPPSYFSPYGVQPDGRPTGKTRVGNITDGTEGEYITDRLTDEALAFLEAHQDEPFFLNLWQYGVHGPWGHKEEYTSKFATKTDPRGEQANPIMASMLKSVDDSLGRVLDKLDELALTENTLFMFYSDNGGNVHSNRPETAKTDLIQPGTEEYAALEDWRKWAGDEGPTNNAPLRAGKGRLYEGGIRVPLMVRWPGKIAEGTVSDAIVASVDLYPTILGALNVAPPVNQLQDGYSFLEVLTGERSATEREALFIWFPSHGGALREGDWKLIRRHQKTEEYPEGFELFNLRDDIGETTNLASKMPGRVRLMDARLQKFLDETSRLPPRRNPSYSEEAEKLARAPEAGLLPRFCSMSVSDGALIVEGEGRRPFLGTAQVRLPGPVTLTLVARTSEGVKGRIQWRTVDQETFPEQGQIVDYTLSGGEEWETVTIELPVDGRTATVRIYLPEGAKRTDFQLIRFQSESGVSKSWKFASP